MNEDVMNIEILPDGSVKITTDKISAANHMTAEAFFRMVIQKMGGKAEQRRKANAAMHAQAEDGHIHADGHTHSHA